jgi:hypothetical protein
LPFKCGVRDLCCLDSERQSANDLVDGTNRGGLGARIVDLEHADAGAVVATAGDALKKSYFHLQAVAGMWLLVALPPLRVDKCIEETLRYGHVAENQTLGT